MSDDDVIAEWITLGTAGGPFQHAEASQIANALRVGDVVHLFDVGNGVLRRLSEAGIGIGQVRSVFLTHHHPDHVADLGMIMLTHWLTPGDSTMAIHGPEGTSHLVKGLCEAYRYTALTAETAERADIMSRFTVADVPASASLVLVSDDGDVSVEAISVDHYRSEIPRDRAAPQAVGYRITAPGRTIAYTGDTGPSDALGPLARDADLLVTEVVSVDAIVADLEVRFGGAPAAVLDRVIYNMRHNHLTADEIGAIAAAARVQTVLLTHYVPLLDDAGRRFLVEEVRAAAPDAEVVAAVDLGVY